MKTEYAIIAAVVIIGVLLATNSLLGMTETTSETSTSAAVTSSSTSTTTASTTTTTSSTTSTQADVLPSSTTSTSSTSTTTTTLPIVLDPKATVEITSDKAVYYSNEMMTFTVSVNSSDNLSYSTLSLRGILAGYYRIDEDNSINLSRGVNTISFQYRAPKCYGCSGIRPGKYDVSVGLSYYNRSITNDTTKIELKQA